MELSYERDSRWRPHLSWNFSSCSLEEQAAQRELAWQRLTDRLGTLMVDGGGYKTFAQPDHMAAKGRNPILRQNNFNNNNNQCNQVHLECSEEAEERHQQSQQQPFKYQHNRKEKYSLSIPAGVASLLQPNLMINANKPTKPQEYTNIPDDEPDDYFEHYKKAKRRCLTVSSVLVLLTLLLFTIVILMAIGIVHR